MRVCLSLNKIYVSGQNCFQFPVKQMAGRDEAMASQLRDHGQPAPMKVAVRPPRIGGSTGTQKFSPNYFLMYFFSHL